MRVDNDNQSKTNEASIMSTILKKITSKNVVGNVKAIVKDSGLKDGEKMPLYNVMGIATKAESGESQFGDYIEFHGTFHAVNLISGESFDGFKAFLVTPWDIMLRDALAESEKVEFAISVSVVVRDDLPTGYEYITAPLVEAQRADPLAHLKEAVKKAALPAPSKKK